MFDKNNKKKTSQRCVQGSQVSATGGFGEMVMRLCAGVAFLPLQEKDQQNKCKHQIQIQGPKQITNKNTRTIHQYTEKFECFL